MTLVLASASRARADLLRNAGVEVAIDPARIDESAVKASLLAAGAPPRDVADSLAELKAMRTGSRHPGALVLVQRALGREAPSRTTVLCAARMTVPHRAGRAMIDATHETRLEDRDIRDGAAVDRARATRARQARRRSRQPSPPADDETSSSRSAAARAG